MKTLVKLLKIATSTIVVLGTNFGEDGNAIRPESGEAVIDGQVVYLYESGKQAKGELIEVNGVPHYYDANTGARVSNAILTIKGKTYQFDADGNGKLVG